MKTAFGFIFLFVFSISGFAQTYVYPKNYFHSPVDIPIALAGNFGELRPNHFHTGIDITTHGVEGVPVKAAADGYVSRIKIGPWGYGHVIYITHPNGFTTVYGHLSAFNSVIDAYVKKNQYINESFEIELTPGVNEIPVKQDQVVAFSGNTGSSGGPHLHFEIRDSKTEEAINPLLFGFPVKDKVPPVAQTLVIIPADAQALINGKNEIKKIALVATGNKYSFANPADSIVISGKVGFAMEAYDKENVPTGKNGVYAMKLQCDGKTIYSHKIERIPFEKSRFINSFIDYAEMEEHNHFYQQSFLLPNNQLPIYDSVVNGGYVNFNDSASSRNKNAKLPENHKMKYYVADVFGNEVELSFTIKISKNNSSAISNSTWIPAPRIFMWNSPNIIDEPAFKLETPDSAFYQNEQPSFMVTETKVWKYSPKITIDKKIALQLPCSLTVYATVPENLQSKALLVNAGSAVGGKWTGKGVTAEIKEFGTFFVNIDTTAPVISTKQSGENFSALSQLNFTISDNLSGIATYRATVDGKWILMEYEPKKKLLFYKFDEHVGKGKHDLVLTVTDKVGNISTYKKTFER